MAGIGDGDVDDHSDRRGLARAIWANQTEDATGLYLQAEIANGPEVAEALADVIEDEGGPDVIHVSCCYDYQRGRVSPGNNAAV